MRNHTHDSAACAKINYHHNLFRAWKIVRFWRQTVEVIDGNSSFVWTCSTLICILNDARNNRQQRVLNCFISSNDKYLRPRIFSDWRYRRPVNQSKLEVLVFSSEFCCFLLLADKKVPSVYCVWREKFLATIFWPLLAKKILILTFCSLITKCLVLFQGNSHSAPAEGIYAWNYYFFTTSKKNRNFLSKIKVLRTSVYLPNQKCARRCYVFVWIKIEIIF